jgi:diguanylate cyclase (GGDEF)-like protein
LNQTFDTIGTRYGDEAASARRLADLGSGAAILLLLVAFSIALWRAARLARENHVLLEQSRQDALTDELTGLWNRRKLFADLDELLAHPRAEPTAIGVLDLDGFKAYNDKFGHPAGDALLARMGRALQATVDGEGAAYRLGGDEFCVIASGARTDEVLERARVTLAERAGGLHISCSLGSARLSADGSTGDELIHKADERLYENKRSSRVGQRIVAV